MSEPKTPWNDRNALRDWFAGQALALMVSPEFQPSRPHDDVVAMAVYSLADAMLAESDLRRAGEGET